MGLQVIVLYSGVAIETSRWLPIEASFSVLILLCAFSPSQGLGCPWQTRPEPLTCPRDSKGGSAPDRDTSSLHFYRLCLVAY
jgi:hypothetical protein